MKTAHQGYDWALRSSREGRYNEGTHAFRRENLVRVACTGSSVGRDAAMAWMTSSHFPRTVTSSAWQRVEFVLHQP